MPDNPRYRHRHGPDAETSEVEGRYFCDSCNQEVFVPLDVTAGHHQGLIEECPICGSPMVLQVDIQRDGRAHIDGKRE
ncbi:MAG: CPXCG motif-containing cysteine-rich protein [Planctomycetia bacterium]